MQQHCEPSPCINKLRAVRAPSTCPRELSHHELLWSMAGAEDKVLFYRKRLPLLQLCTIRCVRLREGQHHCTEQSSFFLVYPAAARRRFVNLNPESIAKLRCKLRTKFTFKACLYANLLKGMLAAAQSGNALCYKLSNFIPSCF